MKFKAGQRVTLAPFEGNPKETGVILEVEKSVYAVELDQECRIDEHDDGLREVTEDQIEGSLLTLTVEVEYDPNIVEQMSEGDPARESAIEADVEEALVGIMHTDPSIINIRVKRSK